MNRVNLRDYTVVDSSTTEVYEVRDPADARFGVVARYDDSIGSLNFRMRTRIRRPGDEEERSATLRGHVEFEEMLAFFEERDLPVYRIVGEWSNEVIPQIGVADADNLVVFNRLTSGPNPLSVEEAAARTWTGQQAIAFGFDQISVVTTGKPGEYTNVRAYFRRPFRVDPPHRLRGPLRRP